MRDPIQSRKEIYQMFSRVIMIVSVGLLFLTSSAIAQETSSPATPKTNRAVTRDGQSERGTRRGGIRPHKRMFDVDDRSAMRQLNLTNEQRQQRHAIFQRHIDGLRSQRDQLFLFRQKRIAGSFTAEDRSAARE